MTGLRRAASGVALFLAGVAQAQPLPTGPSDITVAYETTGGPVSFTGSRAYDGAVPGTLLGANIRAMNSVNDFGRRTALTVNPAFDHVLRDHESLISHAFFKLTVTDDYFTDMDFASPNITVTAPSVQFDQPVDVLMNTMMLHVKWNDQILQLDFPYIWVDDHYLPASNFRDQASFVSGGIFAKNPRNFVEGSPAAQFTVTGNGTSDIGLEVVFPYSALKNFEETGLNTVPAGLPGPQGFLEPFHFHIEYVVQPAGFIEIPAASTWGLLALLLGMLAAGTVIVMRRGVQTPLTM